MAYRQLGSGWGSGMNFNLSDGAAMDAYLFAYDVRPVQENDVPQLLIECLGAEPEVRITSARTVVPMTRTSGGGIGAGAEGPWYVPGSPSADFNVADRFVLDHPGGRVIAAAFVLPPRDAPAHAARVEESSLRVVTPASDETMAVNQTGWFQFVESYSEPGSYEVTYERMSAYGGTFGGMLASFEE